MFKRVRCGVFGSHPSTQHFVLRLVRILRSYTPQFGVVHFGNRGFESAMRRFNLARFCPCLQLASHPEQLVRLKNLRHPRYVGLHDVASFSDRFLRVVAQCRHMLAASYSVVIQLQLLCRARSDVKNIALRQNVDAGEPRLKLVCTRNGGARRYSLRLCGWRFSDGRW